MIEVTEQGFDLPSGATLRVRFSSSSKPLQPELLLKTPEGLELKVVFYGQASESTDSCEVTVKEPGGAEASVRMRNGRCI